MLKSSNIYCTECHSLYGCGEVHDIHMYDTGKCSICKKSTECVNCSVCKEVKSQGVSPEEYWKSGKPRL